MSSSTRAPHVTGRGKIALLVSGQWLYGTVNRAEFSKATGDEPTRTRFTLTKQGWRAGRSAVTIIGAHVAAWEWQVPAARAVAKPKAKRAARPLTLAQAGELEASIRGIDANALRMVCVAAGVDSISELTQVTLPAFQGALAAHKAGRPGR